MVGYRQVSSIYQQLNEMSDLPGSKLLDQLIGVRWWYHITFYCGTGHDVGKIPVMKLTRRFAEAKRSWMITCNILVPA